MVRLEHILVLLAAAALTGGCYDGADAHAADDGSSDGGTGGTANDGSGSDDGSGDEAADESSGDSTGLPPIDPDVCPMIEFDNVVDEASCPEVQGRGIEPVLADEIEMCRRLYLDLLGTAPTPAQFAADCEGRELGEIVDDFIARPEYVQLGQRQWADKLRMTSTITYFEYIEDLDALTGQLYTGELGLPELAVQVATHPGYTGRFDGQDLVGYNFLAFLGRDAAPHERLDLQALWHMWEERYVEMHPLYYFGYTRVVANTIVCAYTPWMCHSELWGHHSVVIDEPLPGDYDYEGPNVLAVEDLDDDAWAELHQAGELLAAQPSFYEAAVDESLLRYLGYKAGVEIPLVRQRLVDLISGSGGDIRVLEREILTSQLYRMASAYPDPEGTLESEGSPDFWHGPMKQMTAEHWLDSIEKLTAMELGACDHRFPEVVAGAPTPDADYTEYVWHPNGYPKDPDPVWPTAANKPDYGYRDLARALGGCPDQESQLRFTGTGVMIALSQSDIAQLVCTEVGPDAPMLLPGLARDDISPETYDAVVRHVYSAVTLRELPEELELELGAAVDGCAGDDACDAELISFHMCAALLGGADFLFY